MFPAQSYRVRCLSFPAPAHIPLKINADFSDDCVRIFCRNTQHVYIFEQRIISLLSSNGHVPGYCVLTNVRHILNDARHSNRFLKDWISDFLVPRNIFISNYYVPVQTDGPVEFVMSWPFVFSVCTTVAVQPQDWEQHDVPICFHAFAPPPQPSWFRFGERLTMENNQETNLLVLQLESTPGLLVCRKGRQPRGMIENEEAKSVLGRKGEGGGGGGAEQEGWENQTRGCMKENDRKNQDKFGFLGFLLVCLFVCFVFQALSERAFPHTQNSWQSR